MQQKQWPADQVERRATASLEPDARNARTHSKDQVAQLAASIQEWGWTVPVLVDEEGTIIAGHGRVLAALSLGLAEVPVMVARGWTETQRRAYVLADNKLALNAGWDDALLRVELKALDGLGIDVGLMGFSAEDMGALFDSEAPASDKDPDDAPPLAPAVSLPGDLWVCGPHRVYCGDSTMIGDVERAMGGGVKADACWTDPPYNVNYESKLAGKIKNDNMSDSAFAVFLQDAFVTAFACMKPGAALYVAHADAEGLNFRAAFKAAGFKISGCLIWAKNSLVLGRSDYQWQHEPILYGWKPGAAHRWYGGRKQTTLLQLGGSVFTANPDGTVSVRVGGETLVIQGENLTATSLESSILRVEKPKRSSDHPTMKPVELITKMLRNSTRPGDVVLDLFGGSGSTLIACETLARNARLVELDPKYVDVIVKRWQDFTGQTAVLEGDGRSFESVNNERRETQANTPEASGGEPGAAPDKPVRAKAGR